MASSKFPLSDFLVLARFATYLFCLFQVAEGQIDNLQPLVEHLLKESKLLANREGARGDHIHQALLDLSSRWLKACDEVEKQKKAVRIVPNWYQFRSNMDDIDAWLKKMEQGKDLAVEVRPGAKFKYTSNYLNRSNLNVLVGHCS